MYNYLFQLISGFDVETLKQELHKKGLKDIYVIEEDATGIVLIGGHSRKKIHTENALLIEEKLSVKWEDQWALFAQDFKDGRAHINLAPFGVEKTLLLEPGAGFGDLSHPTTNLMLEMMKGRVEDQTVIDIGTGSGILTLAAVLLGARQGIGIDIDSKAISHAKKNAQINHLESVTKFSKKLPKKIPPSVFLMNMILREQKELDSSQFNAFANTWIVSGILKEQKKEYLKLSKSWGWSLMEEFSRDEWMGWVFSFSKR